MNANHSQPRWRVYASGATLLAALFFSASAHAAAATVWTGPTINFTESTSTKSDTIVAGKVVLTRGANEVLYNTAAGENSAGGSSPTDTMWAFGALSNYATLSYQTMASLRNGNLAGRILNQPMVVHLVNENIYLSVKFTAWGQHFAGGFAYTRSTPAAAAPTPTVSLTRPASATTLAAGASFHLNASASVSSGTVTNVQYFAGPLSLGSATASPWGVVGNIASPGNYALTAVAMAAGVPGTSSVVSLTVVTPVAVTLSGPALSSGHYGFSYNANSGLSYVIQSSPDLTNWTSVVTNVASGATPQFSETFNALPSKYYRVGRLPNP